MVKVGIIGATGYTGVELLRLLLKHPDVSVQVVTSRTENGRRLDALFPTLRGHTELVFTDPDSPDLLACDLVFFATPHNVAMRSVPQLLDAGVRVIDLSADYRLLDPELWSQWYGEPHASPGLCVDAVYGLPGLLSHGRAAGVYATFEGGGGRLAAVNGQLCFGC